MKRRKKHCIPSSTFASTISAGFLYAPALAVTHASAFLRSSNTAVAFLVGFVPQLRGWAASQSQLFNWSIHSRLPERVQHAEKTIRR